MQPNPLFCTFPDEGKWSLAMIRGREGHFMFLLDIVVIFRVNSLYKAKQTTKEQALVGVYQGDTVSKLLLILYRRSFFA